MKKKWLDLAQTGDYIDLYVVYRNELIHKEP